MSKNSSAPTTIALFRGSDSIKDSAFEGVTSLVSINLSEGITSIGSMPLEG